jgi:uncharacterized protein (DUF2141 family)
MLACAVFARPTASAPAAQKGLIHVELLGLRNQRGHVVCALYASAEGFPKQPEKAIARTTADIAGGRAVCEFADIEPGTYAVSAFHDENANGKLDTNFLGIPREGVGASNNARGHFGPPRFEAAAVRVSAGRTDLTITMTYL